MADASRIAVVVIHGMGEHRPMGTIRSFVDAISATGTPPIKSWSKPLDDPALFDVRRIVMEGDRVPQDGTREPLRPVVDFYEFYWSHLLPMATLGQLLRWAGDLVFRRLETVPRHLWRVYFAGWGLLALLALTALLTLISQYFGGTLSAWWPVASGAASVVYAALLSYPLLGTLGDAARYLDTRADNVHARFDIQKAGVALIRRLHDEARYHRIVVVGHSLGAMIGYDVLRQAWLAFAKQYEPVKRRRRAAIDRLRKAVRDWPQAPLPVAEYRNLQSKAWAEHLGNGGRWRVTDFITLGSPLAHAELLMATDPADFNRRTTGRELSTCPPTWDERFGITRDIPVASLGTEAAPKVRSPDHAGVFALVRWTNFHSPSRYVVDGDFLSGPAAPVFGAGVDDVEVAANHVNYWTQGAQSAGLAKLLTAMDLSGRGALPNVVVAGEEAARPPRPASR